VRGVAKPTLSLLSRLWLAEPDAETLSRAADAGLPRADTGALAPAWADLFLLNVYPYGTAFSDVSAELNGPAAASAARRYEAAGYRPPELGTVGAPDHAGLCLGFLAHLASQGRESPAFLAWTLDWLPVCALAVERQPSAHSFYRDMAAATRNVLLASPSSQSSRSDDLTPEQDAAPGDDEEETTLSTVVRFLLAPAACGLFLSRSRLGVLALEAGLRLPFGSRFDVARALFEAAGECGRVGPVLQALTAETEAWDEAYAALARAHPSWESRAVAWRARLAATRERLEQMRRILDSPLELEYGELEKHVES
jgi:TorA maturation chaperone TorD